MHTYLIAYDVANAQGIKHALATELMRIGELWARPLETTWYVRTTLEGADLEARLSDLLDTDDGLLIQPVKDEATLCNTALRWFGQRRAENTGLKTAHSPNVIAFPAIQSQFSDTAVAA
jgi:hypothetical protein